MSTPILEPSLKERMVQSTEEAVVAEATRSINDPPNGSNPADFISVFSQNQNLFLPCCFICRLRRNQFCRNTTGFFCPLENKRSNVQDSDATTVASTSSFLRLTNTPEHDRTPHVASKEGETFILTNVIIMLLIDTIE